MTGEDLSPEALRRSMPRRPIRSYPAVLSTGADAMAWARAGAPGGAVVVADYQVSPRGRAGVEWTVRPGRSLGFSMVVRPRLQAEREGWLYVLASMGLADAAEGTAAVVWPDRVLRAGAPFASAGVHAELGAGGVEWAVLSVVVEEPDAPRAELLARVVAAIERRACAEEAAALADYRGLCLTIGRRVRAHLIPMGPTGVRIQGRATDIKPDGALLIETARGTHVAVRPQNLGLLEERVGDGDGYPPEIRALLNRHSPLDA